jgi:hypothetical protein
VAATALQGSILGGFNNRITAGTAGTIIGGENVGVLPNPLVTTSNDIQPR